MKVATLALALLLAMTLVPSVSAKKGERLAEPASDAVYDGITVEPDEFAALLKALKVLKEFDLDPEQEAQCKTQLLLCRKPVQQGEICTYSCLGTAGGGNLTTPAPCSPSTLCIGLSDCRAFCIP